VENQPDYIDLLACSRMEWEILQLLLLSNDDKPWWRIEEVMEETTDPITALDAMAHLCECNLLRRKGEFIVITVAAFSFHQLITNPPKAEWLRPTA
jgi:hypothetical protein